MSVAIVTNKPYTVKALSVAAAVQFRGNDQQIDYPLIMLNGYYRPPLPRGLSWKDYPFIAPMEDFSLYTARSLLSSCLVPMLFSSPPAGTPERFLNQSMYESAISDADVLISAVDMSATDVWAVEVLRRKFRRPDQPFLCVSLHDYTPGHIEEAFRAAAGGAVSGWALQPQPDWYTILAFEGQVRAYVDHQFMLNSLAVFGRTLGTSRTPTPWVSKYQIQALFAISQKSQSQSAWHHDFRNWKGTGKYQQDPDGASAVMLGSAASRQSILEQLVEHGWVTKAPSPDHFLLLTTAGWEIVKRLHPGCCDPDLPFRIERWAIGGLAASRPAIDHYIRTFFGRQMKFRPR